MAESLKGKYEHSVDAKGRLLIPVKMRNVLGSQVVVCRGLDSCLYLFSKDSWEDFADELVELEKKGLSRNVRHYFVGSAQDYEFDSQGRILLDAGLREKAGITRQAVIVGDINKAEIWAKDKWDALEASDEMSPEAISRMLEEVNLRI